MVTWNWKDISTCLSFNVFHGSITVVETSSLVAVFSMIQHARKSGCRHLPTVGDMCALICAHTLSKVQSGIGACSKCFSAANRKKSCEAVADALYRLDLYHLAFLRCYSTESATNSFITELRSRDYLIGGLAGFDVEAVAA